MKSVQEFETIIIITYFVVLLLIVIIVVSAYNEYSELEKDENKDLNPGGRVAGTYMINPETFTPINEKYENLSIQKVINRHTKAVRIFWIWIAIVLPIIIITFSSK